MAFLRVRKSGLILEYKIGAPLFVSSPRPAQRGEGRVRAVLRPHCGEHAQSIDYDQQRTEFLQARGYGVMRVWDNEALTNTYGVLEKVLEMLEEKPLTLVPMRPDRKARRESGLHPLPVSRGEGKNERGNGKKREPNHVKITHTKVG